MKWAAVLTACTSTLYWPVLAFVGPHTRLPAASLLALGGRPGAEWRGAGTGARSRCAAENRVVAPTRSRSSRWIRCQAGGYGSDSAGDFRFPARQFVRDDWPGPGLSLLSAFVCVRCQGVGLGGNKVVRACVHACACLGVLVRAHVLISLSLRGCPCVFLARVEARARSTHVSARGRARAHTHTHTPCAAPRSRVHTHAHACVREGQATMTATLSWTRACECACGCVHGVCMVCVV